MVRKPDTLLNEYYNARGWDRNGIPMKETLARLGLGEIDEDINSLDVVVSVVGG
jgi:aldehyde:ferredoxin oxidoreductase